MSPINFAIALAAMIGFFAAVIFTPVVRSLFLRWGISDHPDANRKLQKNAVSLGGGLAVFAATLAASIVTLVWIPSQGIPLTSNAFDHRWVLLLAAVGILLLGLADDIFTLRGRQKLFGQVLIVMFLVGAGTVVRSIDIFGMPIELGVMAIPLTAMWLLGAINAVNLIDGADGIASTAGAIICGSLAVLATFGGLVFEATVAAAMAAALLGFLCFNWPPAKIYLGDTGSMLIGLVVGVFSIWSNLKHSTTIAFAIPLAALTVPMFDSFVAIVRRVLTGRSIYSADRGHLHHQLSSRFSPQGMLFIVAGLCLMTGACAIASVALHKQWIALAGTGVVIVGLVWSGWFGAAESQMLVKRILGLLHSFFTRPHAAEDSYRQQTVQLQGSRRWDEIWLTLTEFAQKHKLCSLRLDLNLSSQHEGYHGDWRAIKQPERAERWSIYLPIFSREHSVGKLEISGKSSGAVSYRSVETLAALLQDLQPSVDRLFMELENQSLGNLDPAETQRLGETPALDGVASDSTELSSSTA